MLRTFLLFLLPLLLTACIDTGLNDRAASQNPAQRSGVSGDPRGAQGYSGVNEPPLIQGQSGVNYDPKRAVKVGLLLPLTGKGAALGKEFQDAAILALFDKYGMSAPKNGVAVELIPKDTESSAGGAARAAEEAIAEGAKFLVGPLYTHSVAAAAEVAKAKKVPMLTLSNNAAKAEKGVMNYGYNVQSQVRRIAEYAFGNQIESIAVLAPNNAYGQVVTKAVREVAAPYGARVFPVRYYSADGGVLREDIRKFAEQGTKGGRPLFKALLIPESGKMLKNILKMLKEERVPLNAIQLLSTGVWDDPALHASLPQLNFAWYASAPPEPFGLFRGRFVSAYEYEPSRLASLTYDAIALIATLAENGRLSEAVLKNPRGYMAPANGIFRITDKHVAERGLAVMEIRGGGKTKTIDAAPKKF